MTTPWSQSASEFVRSGGTNPTRGLTTTDAAARLRQVGPNLTEIRSRVTWWGIAAEEAREPMILLLLGVTAGYLLLRKPSEAVPVLGIIMAIVGIEIATEYRAKRAVQALRELASPVARVRRDGTERRIPAENVVPGDILLLHSGDRVAADARLLESFALAVDESALTGESLPVDKDVSVVVPLDTPFADRRNMVWRGTVVTRGHGVAYVVATGKETELGRLEGMVQATREPRTPLQQAMRQLSRALALVALGLSALVPLVGFLAGGYAWSEMVLLGLSLAFATIPEELPILITMVLALGSLRLSRERVLVRRLRAAEVLGCVTAVVCDKTGTLTENRLQVTDVWIPGEQPEATQPQRGAVELAIAAARASTERDAVDDAVLRWARAAGQTTAQMPGHLVASYPFDPVRRRVAAVWLVGRPEGPVLEVAVKGAPEWILPLCAKVADGTSVDAEVRESVERAVGRLAGEGRKVLAVARRVLPAPGGTPAEGGPAEGRPAEGVPGEGVPGEGVPGEGVPRERVLIAAEEELGRDMELVGLIGLSDPLRPEAADAVAAVRGAGIAVYVATGDHPQTATAVARALGLTGEVLTGGDMDLMDDLSLARALEREPVFARIDPGHKLRLVQVLQGRGQVVAMTGDGVNDGPALRAAHVGLAMGNRGTDVAREASGVVLTDDRFASLVAALKEGSRLVLNLRKAVGYYLAVKVALVVSTLAGALVGLSPFSPAMIILMELFMDVAASSAFVTEPGGDDLMNRASRPTRFLDRALVWAILSGGLFLALAVGVGSRTAVHMVVGPDRRTVMKAAAFCTWMAGHVALAFSFRYLGNRGLRLRGLLANRILDVWAVIALAAALVVCYQGYLQEVFGTCPLPMPALAVALGSGLLTLPSLRVGAWLAGRVPPGRAGS